MPVDSLHQTTQQRADGLFYEAVLLARQNKLQEAIALYQKAYQLTPQEAVISGELGLCYERAGQDSLAQLWLERAWRLDTTKLDYAERLAAGYLQKERYGEALRVYETLRRHKEEDENFLFRLAQLYARSGDLKQALKVSESLLPLVRREDQSAARLVNFNVQVLRLQGKKREALQQYKLLTELFPDNEAFFADYLSNIIEEGDYKLAEQALKAQERTQTLPQGTLLLLRSFYELAQSHFPQSEAYLLRLNAVEDYALNDKLRAWENFHNAYRDYLQRQGKSDSTQQSQTLPQYLEGMRDLEQRYPQAFEPFLKARLPLLNSQGPKALVDTLLLAERRFESSPEYWDTLFTLSLETKQSDSLAINIATKALNYVRDDWRYHYVVITSQYKADEPRATIARLLTSLRELQHTEGLGQAKLRGLLADLYAEHGTPQEQAQIDSLYAEAIKYSEEDANILNNYAYRLAKAGKDLDEAERLAAKAVKLEPETSHILDTYAYALYRKGSFALAKLYQRKALENAKGEASADMYEHMGDIYAALDEKEEALTHWRKALTLYQQSKESQEANITALQKKLSALSREQKKKN